ELAASGSKVLLHRCVEYARRYNIPIHVRSSFTGQPGTWISHEPTGDHKVEHAVISGVAHDTSAARVVVRGVPDKPQDMARLFRVLADAGLSIDMVTAKVSPDAPDLTDVSFLVPRGEVDRATAVLHEIRPGVGWTSLDCDLDVARISLVGAGVRTTPGIAATFVEALSTEGVDVRLVSSSGSSVAALVHEDQVRAATRAVHTSFALDRAEGEAVVHAGTGR
ncbi:ACT domain-containing protein, partial [Streptomyces sp. NPDC004787]|uniref:ACT domain-containing protein n=1 Tax=Streptomyces sp. NPDC004787 TaxID=3154291 RepID=UPI0033ADCE61